MFPLVLSSNPPYLTQLEEAINAQDMLRLRDLCETIELEFSMYPNPHTVPLQQQQQQQQPQTPTDPSNAETPQPMTTSPTSTSESTPTAVPTPPVNAPISPYDPRIYTLLLLTYIHTSDLLSARHLYLRTPLPIRLNTDYTHLTQTLTHLYPSASYGRAIETLETVIFSPAYAGPLVQGLVQRLRERAVKRMEVVYDSIGLEQVKRELGWTGKGEGEVLGTLKGKGWEVVESMQVGEENSKGAEGVWLKPPAEAKVERVEELVGEREKGVEGGLKQLANLADFVIHLDR
ncbi:hypothetical protein HDV05_007971 [Chytridiales sp. JEL 0842]|nr:hypothetical protein HDV05_007971 [Chytridiales sp. JEL 0842]